MFSEPSDGESRETDAFTFDGQAQLYDRRVGLPDRVERSIARSVVELATLDAHDTLLEVGAGTGGIGQRLSGAGLNYVGIDLSLSMLRVFLDKLPRDPELGRSTLIQADADRNWPLRDGTVRAIFISRAAHLLDSEHLVREAMRLRHPAGSTLILGRTRREKGCLREEMRHKMRSLLEQRGIAGRSGERSKQRIASALEAHGGRALPPAHCASWRVRETPADSLSSWEQKSGLAGRAVPRAIKREVLAGLESWAKQRFGGLDAPSESQEHYELTSVHLPRV